MHIASSVFTCYLMFQVRVNNRMPVLLFLLIYKLVCTAHLPLLGLALLNSLLVVWWAVGRRHPWSPQERMLLRRNLVCFLSDALVDIAQLSCRLLQPLCQHPAGLFETTLQDQATVRSTAQRGLCWRQALHEHIPFLHALFNWRWCVKQANGRLCQKNRLCTLFKEALFYSRHAKLDAMRVLVLKTDAPRDHECTREN